MNKDYKEIIKQSQTGNNRKVSEIWDQTLNIEERTKQIFNTIMRKRITGLIRYSDGYFPDWDAKAFCNIDLAENTYELKGEFRALDFGSCFVEYKEGENLSGLSLTKSDYYFFLVGHEEMPKEAYLVPTSKLKQIGKEPSTIHTNGGINGSAKGFLLNIDKIAKYKIWPQNSPK